MTDPKVQAIASSKYIRARFGGLLGVSSSLRERYEVGGSLHATDVAAPEADDEDRPLGGECD